MGKLLAALGICLEGESEFKIETLSNISDEEIVARVDRNFKFHQLQKTRLENLKRKLKLLKKK